VLVGIALAMTVAFTVWSPHEGARDRRHRGILAHGIPWLQGWIERLRRTGALRVTTSRLLDAVVGVAAGALALAVGQGVPRVLCRLRGHV
jgi:hypothetical protein